MGGGGSAPDPDPNIGIAQRELAAIAGRVEDRANRESAYFQQNFSPRYMQQMDTQLAQSRQMFDYSMSQAKRYDQRYWDTTARQQDKFYQAVDNYDSATERERIGRSAVADVEQSSAMGMQEMQRNLSRRGVNPGSAAAISAMGDMQSNADLAKAGALTMAQEAARREGINLRGVASGLGGNLSGAAQGYAGQAGSAVPMGMAGINSAVQGWNANNQQYGQAMQIAGQNQAQVGNIGANVYNAQLNYAAANQGAWGGVLGAGIGAAAMYF